MQADCEERLRALEEAMPPQELFDSFVTWAALEDALKGLKDSFPDTGRKSTERDVRSAGKRSATPRERTPEVVSSSCTELIFNKFLDRGLFTYGYNPLLRAGNRQDFCVKYDFVKPLFSFSSFLCLLHRDRIINADRVLNGGYLV